MSQQLSSKFFCKDNTVLYCLMFALQSLHQSMFYSEALLLIETAVIVYCVLS